MYINEKYGLRKFCPTCKAILIFVQPWIYGSKNSVAISNNTRLGENNIKKLESIVEPKNQSKNTDHVLNLKKRYFFAKNSFVI